MGKIEGQFHKSRMVGIFHIFQLRPTCSPNICTANSFSKVGGYAVRCRLNFYEINPLTASEFWKIFATMNILFHDLNSEHKICNLVSIRHLNNDP